MTIRVAIAGVGNCASSLVQGVAHYAKHPEDTVGLMHPRLGEYGPGDIDFVAAFDVHPGKVGQDLSRAIFVEPNCAAPLIDRGDLPYYDVTVVGADAKDGLGDQYRAKIGASESTKGADLDGVVEHLRATQTQVLVSYMPVGSTEATEFYAKAALEAGCGFVNAVPVPLARKAEWQEAFDQAGLPLIGDDIKSQYGATILHRELVQLMVDRGITPTVTYQLNVGGNMDFLNMLQANRRLDDKRVSKTGAVTDIHPFADNEVRIGPSDYVEWLGDKKIALIRLEGKGFGGSHVKLRVELEVEDSPNSAGIVIDAVRACALAMDRSETGAVHAASAWLMKAPPTPMPDDEAMDTFEGWARGE